MKPRRAITFLIVLVVGAGTNIALVLHGVGRLSSGFEWVVGAAIATWLYEGAE